MSFFYANIHINEKGISDTFKEEVDMKKHRVIIIGAGPAGLSVALTLNKLGLKDVVVIEKSKFPRYKCCAGYITSKTKKRYEDFGLNINECHYSLIKDFKIFYKMRNRQNIINKFLYTNKNIDRVELDNKFYELAKSKKIKIIENTTILKHIKEKNNLILSNNSSFFYDYLVFADGSNSYGNRYQKIKSKNIAMQLVFNDIKKEEIQIHFGISNKGYGWVSSYNGITNVGLTDVFSSKNNYEKKFEDFLNKLNIKANLKDLRGTYTPIGIKKPIIDNIYYVGDAVGACDPLTLSGLRYALNTGEFCAKAIANNNNKLYLKYINKLKRKFSFTHFLLKIFYLNSTLFCVFEIGCRYFGKLISWAFNNFFINKK